MSSSPSEPTDAFIQLLTTCQPQLRAVIMSGVGNYADCQDVLQKTNLALWKKANEFDQSRSFIAWSVGIARFEILAFIRDRRRDRLVFTPEVAELLMAHAENYLEKIPDRQLALRKCIGELPLPNRELLGMKYVQRLSTQQISIASGRSIDSIKSLLLRIRKLLAACIERRIKGDLDITLFSKGAS